MFTAALFTVAKTWKLSKCQSVSWWISNQLVYPYSGILLSKKKEHSTDTWINLKNIVLSEKRQTPRTTRCMVAFLCNVQNRQMRYCSGCLGQGAVRMEMGSNYKWA